MSAARAALSGDGMLPLAYSIPDSALVVGYSETTIKDAINKGDLLPSYANTKPVILRTELQRWLESLPHEPRR